MASETSEYEWLRLQNIERNAAKLVELKLAGDNLHALLPANEAGATLAAGAAAAAGRVLDGACGG